MLCPCLDDEIEFKYEYPKTYTYKMCSKCAKKGNLKSKIQCIGIEYTDELYGINVQKDDEDAVYVGDRSKTKYAYLGGAM